MKKRRTGYIPVVACLAAVALPAGAADNAIEEIIVTAQKRSQSLQDAPLAISALQGEDLRMAGFQDVSDIASQVPSLQFQDNGMVARFSLRGINLNSISDASESPILVSFDGVSLGSSSNFAANLFDVERIEVLRGPQGTLYGRNATGGLVNIITRKPTDEFGGYASAHFGKFDERIFEGAVGGPLSEQARFRVSIKSATDNGIQENIIDGEEWWQSDRYAARAQLGFDLSDDAELLLRAHYSEMDGVGPGYGVFGNRDPQDPTFSKICSDADTLAGNCVTTSGEPATTDPTEITSANPPPDARQKGRGGSAELNWRLSDTLSLISLTAYEEQEKSRTEDADATATRGNTIGTFNDYSQFSQELRLQGSGALDWVAGAFYFWSEADVSSNFGFHPGPQGYLGSSVVATDSYALFADGTNALTEKLNLSLGLRFTREDKEHDGVNLAPLVFPFVSPDIEVPFSFDVSNEVVTWRAILDYSPSDDFMYYGSVSTGFKAPGFNTQFLFSADPFAAAPSDKEEVLTYEVGFKGTWLDRRLALNAAAYFSDYEGLQQVLTVPSPIGVNTPVLTNVDAAEIYGAEFDLNFAVTGWFDLMAGASYVHSEIDDPTSKFDGNRVSAAPEWSYLTTARLHVPWENRGELAFQATYRWQDEMYFNLSQNRLQASDSYGVLNVRLVLDLYGRTGISLEAFANNVLDEEYWVHAFGSGAIGGGTVGIWGRPRTYGLKATIYL